MKDGRPTPFDGLEQSARDKEMMLARCRAIAASANPPIIDFPTTTPTSDRHSGLRTVSKFAAPILVFALATAACTPKSGNNEPQPVNPPGVTTPTGDKPIVQFSWEDPKTPTPTIKPRPTETVKPPPAKTNEAAEPLEKGWKRFIGREYTIDYPGIWYPVDKRTYSSFSLEEKVDSAFFDDDPNKRFQANITAGLTINTYPASDWGGKGQGLDWKVTGNYGIQLENQLGNKFVDKKGFEMTYPDGKKGSALRIRARDSSGAVAVYYIFSSPDGSKVYEMIGAPEDSLKITKMVQSFKFTK